MTPYYADEAVTLHHGDALDVLRTLPDASVDAVVTDPPYELGFMGRAWDASGIAYNVDLWREAWRVLKPGGHLLAFGGTRTVHRLTCAVEDAGFEIRDGIDWLYASGFPKSLDVSKAIDKQRDDKSDIKRVSAFLRSACDAAGLTDRDIDREFGFAGRMAGQWLTQADWVLLPKWEQWRRLRELIGFGDEMDAEVWRLNGRKGTPGEAWQTAEVLAVDERWNEPSGVVNVGQGERQRAERLVKAANTDDARRWAGWGTALKPAREPIVVARKPLAGTVAANVLAYGTGPLNIDDCRVEGSYDPAGRKPQDVRGGRFVGAPAERVRDELQECHAAGRWPSNVVLSHAPDCGEQCVPGCPVAELDRQSGVLTSGTGAVKRASARGGDRSASIGAESRAEGTPMLCYGDTGGASRFFPVFRYEAKAPTAERPRTADGTAHPTVKPLDLMRWLVRLVTPPGGTVLEPFAGSGTTAEACVLEGFRCIAVEREAAYLPLIVARLTKPLQPALDFGAVA